MGTSRACMSLILAATLACATLPACGGSSSTEQEPEPAEQQEQIANPFIDCESASEAAGLAGFDVTFPESVPGYSERSYQAIEGQMAQCFYHNGGTEQPMVLIRKAVGEEDISGDYNEYSQTTSVTVGDVNVTERGNNDLVFSATWTKDGYSFAIDADEGLEAAVVEQLVAGIA